MWHLGQLAYDGLQCEPPSVISVLSSFQLKHKQSLINNSLHASLKFKQSALAIICTNHYVIKPCFCILISALNLMYGINRFLRPEAVIFVFPPYPIVNTNFLYTNYAFKGQGNIVNMNLCIGTRTHTHAHSHTHAHTHTHRYTHAHILHFPLYQFKCTSSYLCAHAHNDYKKR